MIIRLPTQATAKSTRGSGAGSEEGSRATRAVSMYESRNGRGSGTHGFGLARSRGGLGLFQGGQQLVDTEWLVEDETQAILAGLDDRVRRVVAVGRHEDD